MLQKARELSVKLFETDLLQLPLAKEEKTPLKQSTANPTAQKQPLQTKMQTTEQEISKIPPKPAMSAEAAAYPKLLKIYKELNRQNGIIFDAERERNNLELERDNLKGLAKLTKKGELQSRIDRKNGEIDLLKIGLSGTAKRYGFQTVHDFYKAYAAAKNTYDGYRDKSREWEEKYGENAGRQDRESVYKRLRNYQRENTDQQLNQTSKSRNRWER